ncbi:MAG: hypothetical protein ACREL7_12310 [Longimicrobiales bacterium]
MQRFRFVLALAFLPVTACHWDAFGIDGRDFEGVYSLAGTVDGELGDAIVGTITVTRQRGGRADVTVDWSYLDRGVEIIHITTDTPAEADLDSDGDIDFEFFGDLLIDGEYWGFQLTHEGRLRGGTMHGFWRLTTDLPTDDSGSFTADRY